MDIRPHDISIKLSRDPPATTLRLRADVRSDEEVMITLSHLLITYMHDGAIVRSPVTAIYPYNCKVVTIFGAKTDSVPESPRSTRKRLLEAPPGKSFEQQCACLPA